MKLQSLFCEERTIKIQQNITIIFCCFNLHVQFNYVTWCLQYLKMQLLNHFIYLQELDCSGEYLKPVIVDSLCNIEISGDKRKSDCPIFAVCWAALC